MTIKPLSNRVVLKNVESEKMTKTGILLPSASQEKPQFAEVIAIGPGETKDGDLVPMTVKIGNKVIVGKYAGTEVKIDEQTYIIVKEDDILAIVE